MKIQYDCIAGYHLNYLTCGIAKFNLMMGRKMGVPFHNLYDSRLNDFKAPILSIKLSEFTNDDLELLPQWIEKWVGLGGYSVFLHGYDKTDLEQHLLKKANAVYCGNQLLYQDVRDLNSETHTVWCPGTNMSHQLFGETELTVFSFGMAHKLKTEKYYRLKELLDKTGKTYSILLSTALHEGTSFDESFIDVFNEMTTIFGNHVYFLGYLSDQAVFNYLKKSDFFAAFFDLGLRANNTSVNTALEAGCAVITNLDTHSPQVLVHMKNIIDINQAENLPTEKSVIEEIRNEAALAGGGALGWDALLERLGNK